MAIADVWRDLGREIDIFSGTRLNQVPSIPGVYAWFYPLKLTTKEIAPLISEIHAVSFFDPKAGEQSQRTASIEHSWKTVEIELREEGKHWRPPSGGPTAAWEIIKQHRSSFDAFRRDLLKASILLPPLYIGKTKDLFVRCWQHINGQDGNYFHNRYEEFAKNHELSAKRVQDLLFASIQTGGEYEGTDTADVAELLESILKTMARPNFGLR